MGQGRRRKGLAEGWIVLAAALFFVLLSLLARWDDFPRETLVEPVRSLSAQALATPAPERLDLNLATAGELETLPGIGEKLAQRIVDYRAAHGAFADVDALDAVEGIGAGKIEAIRALVFCGGEVSTIEDT